MSLAFARTLPRRYAERRFTVLFAALLLTISGHGWVGAVLPVANPLDWLLGISLVAVVLSVRRGPMRWVLGAAAAGFAIGHLLRPLLDHPAPVLFSEAFLAVACLLTAGVAVRRALSSGPVDQEHIFAALDAYLLTGLAFGVVYWLLETALPGSFSARDPGALTPERATYLSFVVQATLGFGDIVPIGPRSQGLVIVQAVGGQMYLAVLVARLVSLYSAQERR